MKRKILTIIIILLFIGTSAIPISSSVEKERNDTLINRQKNISRNVENLFIIGKISNTTVSGDYKEFDIEKIRVITFIPFILITYLYGFCAIDDITGFIGKHCIFGLCDVIPCWKWSMIINDRDSVNHSINWTIVTTLNGLISNSMPISYFSWALLNDNGVNVSGTMATFHNYLNDYVCAGDWLNVQVINPGYYVLKIYDKNTFLPIFESNPEYFP